jgi:hypothetical protein
LCNIRQSSLFFQALKTLPKLYYFFDVAFCCTLPYRFGFLRWKVDQCKCLANGCVSLLKRRKSLNRYS